LAAVKKKKLEREREKRKDQWYDDASFFLFHKSKKKGQTFGGTFFNSFYPSLLYIITHSALYKFTRAQNGRREETRRQRESEMVLFLSRGGSFSSSSSSSFLPPPMRRIRRIKNASENHSHPQSKNCWKKRQDYFMCAKNNASSYSSSLLKKKRQRDKVIASYWSGSGSGDGPSFGGTSGGSSSSQSQGGSFNSGSFDENYAQQQNWNEFPNREDFENIEWHSKPLNLRFKDLLKDADDSGFWIIFSTVGVGIVAYLESCEEQAIKQGLQLFDVLPVQFPDSLAPLFTYSRIADGEIVLQGIFLFEFFLRLWTEDFSLQYLRKPLALIDFLALLPTFGFIFDSTLGIGGGAAMVATGTNQYRPLRIFRLFRLLRLLDKEGEEEKNRRRGRRRRRKTAREIELEQQKAADREITEKIVAVLVEFLCVFLISAELFFDIEYESNDKISDVGDAIYWSFLTLTGIGQPFEAVTAEGRVVTVISILTALVVVPIQLAAIASARSSNNASVAGMSGGGNIAPSLGMISSVATNASNAQQQQIQQQKPSLVTTNGVKPSTGTVSSVTGAVDLTKTDFVNDNTVILNGGGGDSTSLMGGGGGGGYYRPQPSDWELDRSKVELEAARNQLYEYEKEIKYLKAMNRKLDFELEQMSTELQEKKKKLKKFAAAQQAESSNEN
jgi:hypothetical protein